MTESYQILNGEQKSNDPLFTTLGNDRCSKSGYLIGKQMKDIIDSDKGLVNFFMTDFHKIVKGSPKQLSQHRKNFKEAISKAQKTYDDAHEKITSHEHYETASKYAS